MSIATAKRLTVIGVIYCLLLTTFEPGNAETPIVRYVGGTGNGNYTSIQMAINDASPGDIIYVFNGTYNENIRLHKPLHLIGENKQTTIIAYSGKNETISITADGCVIEGFTIKNSTGIFYSGVNIESNHNIIRDNVIADNHGWGVYMFHCTHNVFTNNTFVNDGISIVGNLTEWTTHVIKNNTVNGKKLLFYKNMSHVKIPPGEYGQIILANCTNVTIENVHISSGDQAVVLGHSTNCTVINNIVENNIYGIRLNYADNNRVYGNTVQNNTYGIYIIHSNNNILINNTISFSTAFGCWICCKSNNNILYLNKFKKNNYSAYDSFTNKWYKDKKGNYWSDYTGQDQDHDGIGDEPYTGIQPDGRNIDWFPLGYFNETTPSQPPETNGFTFLILLCAIAIIFFLRTKSSIC